MRVINVLIYEVGLSMTTMDTMAVPVSQVGAIGFLIMFFGVAFL